MADVVARRGAAGSSGSTSATGSGGSGGGAGTEKGPGMIARLIAFYHGVIAEMKKVTWPDRPQIWSATVTIIIFVLILALVITLLDFALQGILIKMIPSLFTGR